ncbi:sigma 54-interacting transcriptional regulator [Limobrevibacterium gyesilva]|uniref:Sigma-54 dependent transcriptional regulator n=1 Tax=Limobrevibacterium gyesilva TaxID=2991712 RepID=A0AA42CDU6_9PROT|nr:sigma-54 dependent transcriptional regulator [Limobrevibacterium gyesilva]MCW3475293.1 sigma-54 dependent transcriptional regulator [Limobrevibacterium gyesilva]
MADTHQHATAPPVVLFGGGSPNTEQHLRGAIQRLGYNLAAERPAGEPDTARKCIGVLLTDGDGGAIRRWLHALDRRQLRVLVVVPQGLRVDCDLFGPYDEVIFAPFSSDELDLRLRRLAAAMPRVPAPAGDGLVGQAPWFVDALRTLRKLSSCDLTVLIEGETGTGKELAARALHDLSARRSGAFVPVNCAALPDGMLENELFGHRAGAFTDARMAAGGLVEQADGGTLFLDEIDALSPHAQAVLLRFLQSKEYRRLGGDVLRHADARVVAAANTSLAELTAARRFRADLYFRLDVGRVVMPPLRERPGDAMRLAIHFLDRINATGPRRLRFAPDTLAWIEAQPWPGNVRELQSFVERQAVLAEHDIIAPPATRGPAAAAESLRQVKAAALQAAEAGYLQRVMRDVGGNVSAAARLAGTERRTFGRLLKKHGLDRRSFQDERGA